MQITAYGATGTFGAQLVPQLRERGHRVAEAAAEQPGTSVAVLSIAFRPEAAESRLMGYYQGKAMQERIFRRLVPDEQLLMFRSAQWFELVDTMTVKAGPLRFVPKMRVQALAVTEDVR